MGDDRDDRLERHYEALLKSYGDIMIAQAATDRTIEERTRTSNERAGRFEKGLDKKADTTALDAVVAELGSIKRLLIAVLLAIVVASVGFGFAALQIAGSHS